VIVSPLVRPLVLAAGLAIAAAGCGSGSDEPSQEEGSTDRAIERLVDYGLTTEQATCVVDELGAPAVTESADVNALVESEPYRDAIDGCVDAG
jgi:hypothetical protein